jgi:hypothetical protein
MSDEFRDKQISRRDMLKTIGRAVIAACVSGSGLFAFAKKRIALRGEQACGDRVLCEGCPRLEDCVLPRALLPPKERHYK